MRYYAFSTESLLEFKALVEKFPGDSLALLTALLQAADEASSLEPRASDMILTMLQAGVTDQVPSISLFSSA